MGLSTGGGLAEDMFEEVPPAVNLIVAWAVIKAAAKIGLTTSVLYSQSDLGQLTSGICK